MELLKVGQLVTSKRGRDSGKKYVVVGFYAHNSVQVADGFVRSVARPKRKNIKHLTVHGFCLEAEPNDKAIREFIKEHSTEENRGEEGSTNHGQG